VADRRERREPRRDEDREELDERVVDIKRVAKVIKGGRRFAFRTVVIVGDNRGRIGVGVGKARGVPDSIRKGAEHARRNMRRVALSGSTIPYEVTARYGGARVLLKPASPGTGVIAGGGVRAVLEAAGVSDILTKSQGSPNLLNVAMATIAALEQLRSPEEMASMRGKPVEHVRPFWERQPRPRTERAASAPAAEAVAELEEAQAEETAPPQPEAAAEPVTPAEEVAPAQPEEQAEEAVPAVEPEAQAEEEVTSAQPEAEAEEQAEDVAPAQEPDEAASAPPVDEAQKAPADDEDEDK
jgi:small subunit ribosomal protein S5